MQGNGLFNSWVMGYLTAGLFNCWVI